MPFRISIATLEVVRSVPACIYAVRSFSRITALSLARSAWTHELLRRTAGTSASSTDHAVAGMGFVSSLIKYRAPIL